MGIFLDGAVVIIRPLCQIELGILGFGDLRQDYKVDFKERLFQKRKSVMWGVM